MSSFTREYPFPAGYGFSSNRIAGAACFGHGLLPRAVGPVFRCEACGREYCPCCTAGPWHDYEIGDARFVWYRCPACPIGSGFVMLPQATGRTPADRLSGGAVHPWQPAVVADGPSIGRPGAYLLEFPRLLRQGTVESYRDEAGQCFDVYDRTEYLRWLFDRDGVRLTRVARPGGAWEPLERGEYVLAERPPVAGERGPVLALFTLRPAGFHESVLPDGWPTPGPVRVQPADRIWSHSDLARVLQGGSAGVGANHLSHARRPAAAPITEEVPIAA
jgi:hypothetical protein